MKSCAQSTASHSYRYVDDEHTVPIPVPGTGSIHSTLSGYQVPGTGGTCGKQEYPPLLDIRSESIIYVGLQWYKIERTFYKAGAEKMNHGGSKQKPLLTELAVRKNVDESPTDFRTDTVYVPHFSVRPRAGKPRGNLIRAEKWGVLSPQKLYYQEKRTLVQTACLYNPVNHLSSYAHM